MKKVWGVLGILIFVVQGLDPILNLFYWFSGLAVLAIVFVGAIYPSVHSSPEFDQLVESYPDALKALFGLGEGGSITSGAGYLDVELFSLMLPLLVLAILIVAVLLGAVAGALILVGRRIVRTSRSFGGRCCSWYGRSTAGRWANGLGRGWRRSTWNPRIG